MRIREMWLLPALIVLALGGLTATLMDARTGNAAGIETIATGAGQPQGRGRGRGGVQQPIRKRLLAWADTRNGVAQHDSVSHALAVIEGLGYESGMWDTLIRTDSNVISTAPQRTDGSPASGGPSLANVDAIFFMGHREVPIDEDQREELLEFVRDGGGFVAAHVALTAFESWPEFLDLIGARYDGHPIDGPGAIINERPGFPATSHLPATFRFNDEFYLPGGYSRDTIDVLLRLDLTGVSGQGLPPNGDYPLAWAKTYGRGRVFFGSFAHASSTWDIRELRQMYFEAIRWALGLNDAEVLPHPMRDPQQVDND
jgi:type 1 glutamine amidotransferase